jgi:poly(3-hydroxybutyrate) depolymerase
MDEDESGRNSTHGEMLSILGARNFWANHKTCQLQKTPLNLEDINNEDETTVKRVDYQGCQGGPLAFYAIQNGGHQWAGHYSFFGTGRNNYDINATELIWKFFNQL